MHTRAAAAATEQAAGTASSAVTAKRAVIAGAGPSGALAALFLARAGWTVTVCDRRGSASEAFSGSATLGYNMGLNDRALKVRAQSLSGRRSRTSQHKNLQNLLAASPPPPEAYRRNDSLRLRHHAA